MLLSLGIKCTEKLPYPHWNTLKYTWKVKLRQCRKLRRGEDLSVDLGNIASKESGTNHLYLYFTKGEMCIRDSCMSMLYLVDSTKRI